jgi:tRNA U34 5-methylaminomethyl-2-thiouridine-forming methyltransferase MnmC
VFPGGGAERRIFRSKAAAILPYYLPAFEPPAPLASWEMELLSKKIAIPYPNTSKIDKPHLIAGTSRQPRC